MISTRLTERLGLKHPIISAPMATAAGGGLAAAVSAAGGLGLIGGGYGDADWLERQFRLAGNERVGCGFITWSLRKRPDVLDMALDHGVTAICLSFDDPEPFARMVRAAGRTLICQIQTVRDAQRALDCGADVVIAQGGEAGGHGAKRGTLTLVPEIADLIATRSPDTILCAAGGIADGRGLAAALMLGADGVLVGTRLWASSEAEVGPRMQSAALASTGDDTVRTTVPDVAREFEWPAEYTIRVLQNDFTRRWHGHEAELAADIRRQAPAFRKAFVEDDPDRAVTIVGEAVGLIGEIEPAALIIERMVKDAEDRLASIRHDRASRVAS